MGLDASVRCRCWEERRFASPPPYAEHVRLDADGYLNLDLPWEDNAEKHVAFAEWRARCCPHEDMGYALEHISNWGGYRLFQQKLREFGVEQFPALRDILPEVNGGLAPAARCAEALAELDDFARRDFGTKFVLIDEETGENLWEYVESYQGVVTLAPGG